MVGMRYLSTTYKRINLLKHLAVRDITLQRWVSPLTQGGWTPKWGA